MKHRAGTFSLLSFFLFSCSLFAADKNYFSDTLQTGITVQQPNYDMDAVVITAERAENKLAQTTSSSSLLTAGDVQNLPVERFSDVLNSVPGIMMFKKDGLGRDAIISTRGFYGGGEAEYVLVYKNGVRLNDLETGLVDWNAISPDEINKIEIVRGTTSALYGDVATGGILNITTNEHQLATSGIGITYGDFGEKNIAFETSGQISANPYHLYFRDVQSDGFRKHNAFKSTSFGAELNTPVTQTGVLSWSLSNRKENLDDAGPLTMAEMNTDRESSDPFYLSDGRNDKRLNGSVLYKDKITSVTEIRTGIYYQHKNVDIVRTIPFATFYADTKERDITSSTFGFDASVVEHVAQGNNIVAGGEVDGGKLRSTYYDYTGATSTRLNILAFGEGKRTHFGVYVHDEATLFSGAQLNAGVRYDNFSDENSSPSQTSSNNAFSPKIGFNYLYTGAAENPRYAGNVYVNASRAFKVPSLDQLFDQRPYQTGFGPTVTISNASLKPQYGWNYEIGFYQRGKIIENILFAELQTSVYMQKMKDEIDFDFATFKYGNIQQTKHSGIENGLKLHWLPNITAFLNYTYTSVTYDGGVNSGNQLKAIPKSTSSVGFTYNTLNGFAGTVTWNYFGKRFIDDQNLSSIDASNEVNTRFSYMLKAVRLYVDFNNILDAHFSDMAFQLPLDNTTVYYPHAPREFRLGIETTVDTPWFSN